MAEIHPNDIGLATYNDVGDVANLRTVAKTVVEAINEIQQTGGNDRKIIGNQILVEGEDNVIIGENNIVYGSNNFIIGSNNTIVGDNHTIIQNGRSIFKSFDISMEWFDAATKKIYYYTYSDEEFEIPFNVGDKVLISTYISWTTPDWMDYVSIESPVNITEITEINTESNYIRVADLNINAEPPDDIHTMQDYSYISTFIVLNTAYKSSASQNAGVNMGSSATGQRSVSFNYGNASGSSSLAGNSGQAKGNGSAAFNSGNADLYASFAANSGRVIAEKGAAFNDSYCYNSYAFTTGYYCRAYGRVLKCVSMNNYTNQLTVEPGQQITDLTGKTIVLRMYNKINTIIMREIKVESVSGNVLQLDRNMYFNTNDYAQKLLPGNLAFVMDTSSSHGQSNFVTGSYNHACKRYSFAQGYFTNAINDYSVIFGKYGLTDSDNGIFLANGTSAQAPGLAFKVLSDGSVHADGEYTSPCADYAEYFEWADGNPDNEDRAGFFVKLDGDKIVKCNAFDEPIGIVSAMPAIIGDSGEMHWQGKYVTDDFGRIQYHDVTIPAETDEDGNIIVEEHVENQPVINPEWDSSIPYIPRKDRPEWATVGVLGKLVVYDDGTLNVGDKCRCGENGIAVKAKKDGFPVLKRVSADKILVWIK